MSQSENKPSRTTGQNPENNSPTTAPPTSRVIRELFKSFGVTPTPGMEARIGQMKNAEDGDVIAAAGIAAEDAVFHTKVMEPVN